MSRSAKLYLLAAIVFTGCNILFFTPGNDLPKLGDWFGKFNVDKLIHSGVFALMSFLFMLPGLLSDSLLENKKSRFFRIVILFCLWRVATEFIQKFFIPGRNFSLADILADGLGTILALGIAHLALRIPALK